MARFSSNIHATTEIAGIQGIESTVRIDKHFASHILLLYNCFGLFCEILNYRSCGYTDCSLAACDAVLHGKNIFFVLFISRRSLRNIGPPFRGFLVWKCAIRSGWPVHWLHKFYSSWYDCQSHLAVNQETWVRNGRWILLTKHFYSCP